jgi:hypothetical protein
MFCGFPLNAIERNTPGCPIYTLNPQFNLTTVSSNQVDALCFNNATNLGAGCARNSQFDSARKYMSDEYTERVELDLRYSLSVLFNCFIWCQIFNEICSRRIKDEYDFFVGLFDTPIFPSVIVITAGAQVGFNTCHVTHKT